MLTNPIFLTRLAGLIALAISLYFPGANEEKLTGFIVVALSFIAGKFEKQPELTKGSGGSSASGPARR